MEKGVSHTDILDKYSTASESAGTRKCYPGTQYSDCLVGKRALAEAMKGYK